jgi:hypothetical protein
MQSGQVASARAVIQSLAAIVDAADAAVARQFLMVGSDVLHAAGDPANAQLMVTRALQSAAGAERAQLLLSLAQDAAAGGRLDEVATLSQEALGLAGGNVRLELQAQWLLAGAKLRQGDARSAAPMLVRCAQEIDAADPQAWLVHRDAALALDGVRPADSIEFYDTALHLYRQQSGGQARQFEAEGGLLARYAHALAGSTQTLQQAKATLTEAIRCVPLFCLCNHHSRIS